MSGKNQDFIQCSHCSELQQSFILLQDKESKLRKKFENLSNAFADLQLELQLLREENQLLKAMKPPEREAPPPQLTTEKVTQVLDGFDHMLESQGSEISTLINHRDSLASLAFNALSVISKQENVISKFRNATTKLMSFISEQPGETATSVSKEFALLGIDTSNELDALQRKLCVKQVCQTGGKVIEDEKIVDVLDRLSSIKTSDENVRLIAEYVTQQIEQKNELRQQIEASKQRAKQYRKELTSVSESLKLSKRKSISVEIIEKFKEMKHTAASSTQNEFILREIVNVIVKFASKYEDDVSIKCCIARMQRWLENSVAVDISQEVNFLLGMLVTNK